MWVLALSERTAIGMDKIKDLLLCWSECHTFHNHYCTTNSGREGAKRKKESLKKIALKRAFATDKAPLF
jgi:hypothetical protein